MPCPRDMRAVAIGSDDAMIERASFHGNPLLLGMHAVDGMERMMSGHRTNPCFSCLPCARLRPLPCLIFLGSPNQIIVTAFGFGTPKLSFSPFALNATKKNIWADLHIHH